VEWIHLAQGLDKWWAVVDTIITFGSLKVGNFQTKEIFTFRKIALPITLVNKI
jgi:hypothetical protein